MTRFGMFLLAMLTPSALAAQAAAPPPATAGAVDPARLVAARQLIDQIMPPASREQMVRGMMTPMIANIRQGLAGNPQFAKAISGDRRVKAIFDRFMERQIGRMTAMLQAGLPGMADAMAKAYARRFDVAQLGEIAGFFRTPTGSLYMRQSMTIMSDPDIAAWQRSLMTQSMSHIQDDTADLVKEVAALSPSGEKP